MDDDTTSLPILIASGFSKRVAEALNAKGYNLDWYTVQPRTMNDGDSFGGIHRFSSKRQQTVWVSEADVPLAVEQWVLDNPRTVTVTQAELDELANLRTAHYLCPRECTTCDEQYETLVKRWIAARR